jgi:hypothetical protein
MKYLSHLSLFIALGLAGCAQNAALEITLDLPPGPSDGTTVYVLTQPRSAAENPFTDEWRGDDLPAIELMPGMAIEDQISVLSTDDSTDLNLKVRFCANENCTAIEDDMAPERWYALEHPFYIGERTYWSVSIPTIPTMRDTEPTPVEMCDIRGCVDGDLSSYCRVDGRHLCE